MEDGKSPWDVFAQKYIGSVSECYRMSLKALCGLAAAEKHGDERYTACMATHFGRICPASTPFPCRNGCNQSYQQCRHLPPKSVVPGYFVATSPHVAAHRERFRQFIPAAAPRATGAEDDDEDEDGVDGGGVGDGLSEAAREAA